MDKNVSIKTCPDCRMRVPAHVVVCSTTGCYHIFPAVERSNDPKQLSLNLMLGGEGDDALM